MTIDGVPRRQALPLDRELCRTRRLVAAGPALSARTAQAKRTQPLRVHWTLQVVQQIPTMGLVRAILSIPRIGIQTATTLLAEASHLLAAKDRAGLSVPT